MTLFETKDQYKAAILTTLGLYSSFEVRQNSRGRSEIWYLFLDPEACENFLQDHFSGNLAINSLDFVRSLGDIREIYKSI